MAHLITDVFPEAVSKTVGKMKRNLIFSVPHLLTFRQVLMSTAKGLLRDSFFNKFRTISSFQVNFPSPLKVELKYLRYHLSMKIKDEN
jgi:hypothetical protein